MGVQELLFSFQEVAERKRLFYMALKHWAQSTGGKLLLADAPADVEALARRLNREPGTGYSLSYLSSQPEGRDRQLKIRTRNPQLSILQSQHTYFR
jgi:hypothetical protein